MRPRKLSYTPADDDTDGFANDQTGASCTLAASSAGDGMAHFVIITNNSAVDHSDNSETFTITGTDADDFAQTETIAGPAASVTTTTTKYFKTVTSVVPSITWVTDTYDVGWTDDVVSPTFPLNYKQEPTGIDLGIDVSGTIDVTVQHCMEPLQSLVPSVAAPAPSTLTWWNHEVLTSKTADAQSYTNVPVTAVRLKVNSLTSGATVALHVVQGR